MENEYLAEMSGAAAPIGRSETAPFYASFVAADTPVRVLLVIDDEPHLGELLRVGLAQAGWEVLAACTEAEAIQALASCQPQLILAGLHWPARSRLRFLASLKANARWNAIPIIALWDQVTGVTRILTAASGVEAFVSRPFLLASLALWQERQIAPPFLPRTL